MKSQSGITLVTVVIMVVILSIIAAISIISSGDVLKKSKEETKSQNLYAVQTVVSKYSAKAGTVGILTPANEKFPGTKNPAFEYIYENESGDVVSEQKNVGADWYLLTPSDLEELGVEYLSDNYLVNYKENIVIQLNSSQNVFEEIETKTR